MVERDNDVTGVLGSSPYVIAPCCVCTRRLNPFVMECSTLVVIFAPLTLVHVMVAVYVSLV